MNLAVHPEPGAPQVGAAAPFRLTPDLKYVFLSRGHAAAAAALEEALGAGRRIIAFAGEPGTGKTTLLTRLRSDPRHADRTIVYCPYPALSIGALLQDFLGGPDASAGAEPDSPEMVAKLIAAQHRRQRLILIVDDATRCPPRLLTELCGVAEALAKRSSTLQVILAASPAFCQEIDRILDGAGMPAAAHIELPPMDVEDVAAYVRHRMAVAGLSGDAFSTEALAEIAQYSMGVARMVNQICSRALMLSEWRRVRPISRRLVVEAITDCPIDALVAPRAIVDDSPSVPPAASAASPSVLPDDPVIEEPAAPAIPAAPEPGIEAAPPESVADPGSVPPAPAISVVEPIPESALLERSLAEAEALVPTVAAAPEPSSELPLAEPSPGEPDLPQPAPPAAEPIPELAVPEPLASVEIDVPAPPSVTTKEAERTAGESPTLAAMLSVPAERPVGRDSWALREAARRRRRVHGDLVRPSRDDVQTPRFSGFVARRSAPPLLQTIASPGPIAPTPLPPHNASRWLWPAVAMVMAAIAVAIVLQNRELVVRIERALPSEMQGRLTPVSDQMTTAIQTVLRALR